MAGVALSLLVILILSGVGISLSLKLLQNYKPGRTKIQGDLKQIKAELRPWIADLVPWSAEEMEQLSLNQINRTTKKGVVKTSKGIFTTIYHEPVVVWAYRKYVGQKENGLLYARTSNKEFVYRLKNGGIEMVIGDQLVGILNEQGILFNHKGDKQIAQINRQNEGLLLPVKVKEKLVGGLANPARKQQSNARAFQNLSKMEKEEEELFLSLSILEMVRREVGA